MSEQTEPATTQDRLVDTDYFRSGRMIRDPYEYWDALRSECPVHQEPNHGVYMVTGYDEALAVYHDQDTFSSVNSVIGPFASFPVPLEGDDITDLIASEAADTEALLAGGGRGGRGRGTPTALGTGRIAARAGDQPLPAAELEALIADLTEQMHTAAEELQFELAARYRDEVGELKKELRAMREAGAG